MVMKLYAVRLSEETKAKLDQLQEATDTRSGSAAAEWAVRFAWDILQLIPTARLDTQTHLHVMNAIQAYDQPWPEPSTVRKDILNNPDAVEILVKSLLAGDSLADAQKKATK